MYAFFTYKILKANQAAVNEMRTQNLNFSRPLIQPSLFIKKGTNLFGLRIRNNGLTAAKGIRLSIDRDFYTFANTDDSSNLRSMSAFNEPISSMGPGAELEFLLAQGPVIFADDADRTKLPIRFEVKVEYAYADRKVCEETTIDFRPYRHANIPQNDLVDEIRKVHKSLDELVKALKAQDRSSRQ